MADVNRVERVWSIDPSLEQTDDDRRPQSGLPVKVEDAAGSGCWSALLAENHELRAVLERLRAERGRLVEQQQQLMTLLKATSPDKLVHDLRNVLNERELFKALLDVSGM